MKVKVAAIRIVWGHGRKESIEDILARGLGLAEQAAEKGAKYIALPENFLHSNNKADQLVPGPLTDRVVEIAKKRNVHIVAGMIESEQSKSPTRTDDYDDYLSAAVIGPEGVLSVHRKVDVVINPMAREWKRGNPTTDCGVWSGYDFEMHKMGALERVGIFICRDSRTNWAWTRMLSQDPQIIFHPNLRSSIMQYGANLPEMAKRYGVPICAPDGHPESESLIIDRDGTILEMETEKERALIAEVELADEHPEYVTFEVTHNYARKG
jgi:predicted amidohydrolase